uniref:CRISPR system Cms protein Csm4 n=1 Tax=Desulfatirhabdium butyrativorans TaxID=340467 RepID=A0A7C4MLS9_9BACT
MMAIRKGVLPESSEFQGLFIQNPVCFPDLLPADSDGFAEILPLTAISCKRNPGFQTEGKHGVQDALPFLAAAALEQTSMAYAFSCMVCGQDTKPFYGFWNGSLSSPAQTDPVLLYQRHTGIDRHTGTVANSIFYVTQGIAEGRKDVNGTFCDQFLGGSLWLTSQQEQLLNRWLAEPIFIGADRTRGMGEVEIRMEKAQEPPIDVIDWDRQFRKRIAGLVSHPLPNGLFFSVDFQSAGVFLDEFLRPSFDWKPDFPMVEEVIRIVRKQTVVGWNCAWQLSKPQDTAISPGSVYLFRYTGNDLYGLGDFLDQLQRSGVGLRKPEGFGRIRVCHPIHTKELIG